VLAREWGLFVELGELGAVGTVMAMGEWMELAGLEVLALRRTLNNLRI